MSDEETPKPVKDWVLAAQEKQRHHHALAEARRHKLDSAKDLRSFLAEATHDCRSGLLDSRKLMAITHAVKTMAELIQSGELETKFKELEQLLAAKSPTSPQEPLALPGACPTLPTH